MKNTIKQPKSAKAPPPRESIIAEYNKLVLQKMQAGLDPELAERSARVQMAQNHGQTVADSALNGVYVEAAAQARRSDPFSGLADRNPPPSVPDVLPAVPIKLPANYRRLVMEKRKAGLDLEQSEAVIRAQLEHEARSAESAASESTQKNKQA